MSGISPSAAAYGLRVEGLAPTRWLAIDGAEDWPSIEVSRHERIADDEPRVDLAERRAYVGPTVPEDEVVHPLLGRIALAFCAELGTDSMHAGAFAGNGGGWAVVGASATGKSTLLAGCAAAGMDVLCDDVLVLQDGRILTGPRCLDLRQPPPTGSDSTPVRDESRHRVTLPPGRAEHPLTGTVHVTWSETLALVPLAPREILRRIFERQIAEGFPQATNVARELASLPGYELRRPRDLARLDGVVTTLQELAASD